MKFMRICWCELCGKTKGTLENFQSGFIDHDQMQ